MTALDRYRTENRSASALKRLRRDVDQLQRRVGAPSQEQVEGLISEAISNLPPIPPADGGGGDGVIAFGPIVLTLTKPLPGATNNASLDDDFIYHTPISIAQRLSFWTVRFESNLAANATFELRRNGAAVPGAGITVTAGTREGSVDGFTEITLAEGDSLEVWQTVGNAENIGGSAYMYGTQDGGSAGSGDDSLALAWAVAL